MPLTTALKLYPALAKEAIHVELNKLFTKYGAIRAITPSAIKPDAIRVSAKLLLKPKFTGDKTEPYKFSAGMAACGNCQPARSYVDTFAATAADDCKLCMLAAYHADAVRRGCPGSILVSDFDIVGAFLQNSLTPENSPFQIVMRLPADIPHELACPRVEVVQALYGHRQSNNIFDTNFRDTLAAGGFKPTLAEPRIFTKLHPTDPSISCSVAMHVDDGLICSTSAEYRDELIALLTARYGPLTYNEQSTTNTGYSISRAADGSVTVTQEGYIRRMLTDLAATDLPRTDNSCAPDLFADPTDTTPVTSWVALSTASARAMTSALLSSTSPAGCMPPPTPVIPNYFASSGTSTPGLPLAPATSQQKAPASTSIRMPSMASTPLAAVKPASTFASAPIFSYAGRQTSCVSSGSIEAEYVALAKAAKKCLHYRQLLTELGFPQLGPTIIKSAINLANAPQVTKNAKHIHTRHHFLRDLVQTSQFVLQYIATTDQVADMLTKPLPKATFLLLRAKLLNLSEKPSPPWSALRGECQRS